MPSNNDDRERCRGLSPLAHPLPPPTLEPEARQPDHWRLCTPHLLHSLPSAVVIRMFIVYSSSMQSNPTSPPLFCKSWDSTLSHETISYIPNRSTPNVAKAMLGSRRFRRYVSTVSTVQRRPVMGIKHVTRWYSELCHANTPLMWCTR